MTERAGALPLPAPEPAEPLPRQVDEAIGWALKVHYNAPDEATRRDFERWLAADPRHGQAWRRIQAMAGEFRGIPAQPALDALRARDRARQQRRRALKYLGLSGAAVGATWLAGRRAPWQRLVADASTATGERRTLQLADGSTVMLNTDTAVSSRMEGGERLLVLLRGEIFVATGPDAGAARKRPFWVQTPHGRLQALGTRFLARLDERDVRVGVQEGAVALHPRLGGEPAVAAAGEQWLMRADASERAGQPGFEPAGWLDGIIAARRMPLADFLAELGRYRNGHLAADPRVAALPVTGVYQLQDTDRALHFLALAHGLRLVYRSRYWVTVEPADGA